MSECDDTFTTSKAYHVTILPKGHHNTIPENLIPSTITNLCIASDGCYNGYCVSFVGI